MVGDTFAFNTQLLAECLRLFDPFKGDKLFVAGNHDLCTHGANSLELYEKVVPQIIRQCGFHYLDQKLFIKGKVGFIGSNDWYDHSSKDPSGVFWNWLL